LLDLHPEDIVLDVGSGDGYWTFRLGPQCKRVWGLEPDDRLLALARQFYRSSHVRYVQGTVESLPFRDGSFDKIISISCLEHFSDPWAGLREMQRVLRPGGRLAISVDSLLEQNSSAAFRQWHRVKHFVNNYFDETSLVRGLEDAGFRPDQDVSHMFGSVVAARMREVFVRRPARWVPVFPFLYVGVHLSDLISSSRHGQIILVSASK